MTNRVQYPTPPTSYPLLLSCGHQEDEKRILTELGRQQAEATGKRLAALLHKHPDSVLHVSSMARSVAVSSYQLTLLTHSSTALAYIQSREHRRRHRQRVRDRHRQRVKSMRMGA